MQVAVPQLTTVVLLAHVVLGCCWHHGHACEVGSGGLAIHEEGSGRHKAGTHAGHHEDVNSSHGVPGKHDDTCEGDRCTFLRTKPTFEDDPSAADALPAWDGSVAAIHVPAPLDLEKTSWGADSFPGKPLLPTKGYLLFRVLLI